MREYVEREDVLRRVQDAPCKIDADGYVWILRKEAMYAVVCAPTAHVRELVPGQWKEENPDYLDGDPVYVCSECGETWNLIDGTPKDNDMNFCPNCGAEMSHGGASDG